MLNQRLTAMILGGILLSSPLSAIAVSQPSSSSRMIAQAKSDNPYRPVEDQFKRLGQELNQNWQEWYWVYRVIKRIARANGLDERPWRIGIMPYYDINAYAFENKNLKLINKVIFTWQQQVMIPKDVSEQWKF